jgi:GPH family glycoside/pentoside/hexuronide:cation symporter
MYARRFFPWIAALSAVVRHDRHVIGYAFGNFGKAIMLGSVDVALLYLLTDIIGIAPGRVSLLMMIVVAGDLVFDLFAGFVAARAERHGIGYPRLIALFAVPCGLAFGAIFSLPLLQASGLAVIATLILFLRCAFAIIDVPHNSLLARVTSDSRTRGRASRYRTIFSSAAAVCVACVVAPLMRSAAGDVATVRLAWLGAAGGVLFAGALLLAAWCSRLAQGATPLCPGHLHVRRWSPAALCPAPDRLFAAMAALALVTGFAMPMFTKTFLYLCTYVLKSPAFAGQVLLVLALSQMLGAAFWITLVRRWDKTTLLSMSHGVAAAGITLFAAAGENRVALLAWSVLIGIGFAGVFMLPWGILADIIDFCEFRHRERRETVWFSTILVLLKCGGAAALATIGWVLGQLGYAPGAPQTESVTLGMKALAFGVPVAGSIAAILILRHVRIGHALHARVRKVNQRRRDRSSLPAHHGQGTEGMPQRAAAA